MGKVELLRQDQDRIRFLAYNTFCEVIVVDPVPEKIDTRPLFGELLEGAIHVQKMLDVYDDTSEISYINLNASSKPIAVSKELFRLLHKLQSISQVSGRTFDYTLGALLNLWNFTSDDPIVPNSDSIKKALLCTGFHNVTLDTETETVFLKKEGLSLDLGAVGKGYAVQHLSNILRSNGISKASVNLGGNLYLLGEAPWNIGVQQPWERRGTLAGSLRLPGNISVSTSGGYDRFFIRDGHIFHHLLNPCTGYPVETDILSSTVVCSDALMGDILSTVLFIGGVECMNNITNALCPDIFIGYVLALANHDIIVSDSIEEYFTLAFF